MEVHLNCARETVRYWSAIVSDPILLTGGENFGDAGDMPNIVTFLGNDAQLNCSDVLSTTTSPAWRKTSPHGTIINITNAAEKYDLNHQTLIIRNASYSDSGMYECFIPGTNRTHRIHVTVLGE